ncbi:MAG TPA: ABC transporter permease [Longimicrobiales bacterium]|nr:ABC transporter permease [Longimicrobiales bacterium]
MDVFVDALREAAVLFLRLDPYVLDIVLLSLRVSGTAVLVALLLGIPVGVAVGLGRFPGRRLAVALIHTGFALPPVVVGLFVYMLLSREGPAGGLELLFTPTAMILAQALLAAPYVAGITLAAVQAVPEDARLQARALGLSPLGALLVHLREARLGIVAAVVAGFGAVISEVGAVMLVGGNIYGETRVMTTAIVLETRRGNFAVAMALGLILLSIAFAVNLFLTRVQQGRRPSGLARALERR